MSLNKDSSDQDVVEASLSNKDNFIFLLDRYKEKLFNYIRRISGLDNESIEDLLQDVFIKVYKNLNDYDNSLKFSSWIYRIAHNEVISSWRKSNARPQTFEIDEDTNVEYFISEIKTDAEVDYNLMKEKISVVLNNLSLKYREVLILKYLEEKDYQEISDITKKSVGTVSSLLSRAKKAFRDELNNENIKI